MPELFPEISFNSQLRPSQADAIAIAREQLAEGQRRLHIVAPPGTGKTVLGLYLWAIDIRCPAVVFSPNSAIQMQWAARTDLFSLADGIRVESYTSTDPKKPNLLTSLTYQSVTLPRRRGEDLDESARQWWIEALLTKGTAETPTEAEAWINDMEKRNPDYYKNRFSGYRKKVRDAMAMGGDALETLHQSAIANLQRLREAEVGLVILDECHHLLGHWGRVLADVNELLGHPVILGLTATPPDFRGKPRVDISRYKNYFGPVDYEVPLPSVVKDGFLAPYQDLVYFTRPTADELAYIANSDEGLTELVEELCSSPSDPSVEDQDLPPPVPAMTDWIEEAFRQKRLGMMTVSSWREFERRDPVFVEQGALFLKAIGRELLPEVPDVPLPPSWIVPAYPTDIENLAPVLDRYIRHGLRRSENPHDREKAVRAIRILRSLGIQVTETGTQVCASPVARVMAYSKSKTEALVPILQEELRVLGKNIRAVILTDYEKTSAVTDEIQHLLDEESGGAIAAFKQLVRDEATDPLDPILVTGSTVLVDDDLAEHFLQSARQWLEGNGGDVELEAKKHEGFVFIRGRGTDWSPRLYVRMITEMFQTGVTRCLVGTRGLLGEGWDASRINVLIDLTAATTFMTVNQLRGRSIRLDSHQPEKLANNWDVICLAPEFRKGLDDYARFSEKHLKTYGVCEDGAIEKGPGHVHAAFTRLKPEKVEGASAAINEEMLSRIARRSEARALWKIGESYDRKPVEATEVAAIAGSREGGIFPPFSRNRNPWSNKSLAAAIGHAVLKTLDELELVPSIGSTSGRARQPWRTADTPIKVTERAGGYVRVFLEESDDEMAELFNQALREVLGPIDDPRYLIPRHIDIAHHNLLSKLLPGAMGRFFIRYERSLAMLHTVPSVFATNKKRVKVFEKNWNEHVSPGMAVFALREEGKKLLAAARQNGQVPQEMVRRKEIFLGKADGGAQQREQVQRGDVEYEPRDIEVPAPSWRQVQDAALVIEDSIQQIGNQAFPEDQESRWTVMNVQWDDGAYWVEAIAIPDVGYPRIKFVLDTPDAAAAVAGYCPHGSDWKLLFTASSGYEHIAAVVADLAQS